MAEKLHIGGVDSDNQRCMRCASMFLDTGWECTDCGYDNMPHFCPPELVARTERKDTP
jgi:ribosomal protein S27AE